MKMTKRDPEGGRSGKTKFWIHVQDQRLPFPSREHCKALHQTAVVDAISDIDDILMQKICEISN
jgi:hypothetical protein